MEKNKKISFTIIILVIAIIIIAIMGYLLYDLQNKNKLIKDELDAKTAEIKNQENVTEQDSGKSFSEIMNILYTENGTKIGANTYTKAAIIENVGMDIAEVDEAGNTRKESSVHSEVFVYDDGKICFYMDKTQDNPEIDTTIEGINEEVVSVKIIPNEGTYCTPSIIYFLTRNGNVYYMDEEMILKNNFNAKKIDNLEEIITIEESGTIYEGSMEGSTTVIATKYGGEKIDLVLEKENKGDNKVSEEDSVSYITVEVEDKEAQGLAYKSKKIEDKDQIADLMKIINNAQLYNETNFIADIGDCPPSVTIYLSNGESYHISAGDNISDGNEEVNIMLKWNTPDGSDKTMYKVDTELAEYIENLYNK